MNPFIMLFLRFETIFIIQLGENILKIFILFSKCAPENSHEQHIQKADYNIVCIILEKTLLNICFSEVKQAIQYQLHILVDKFF